MAWSADFFLRHSVTAARLLQRLQQCQVREPGAATATSSSPDAAPWQPPRRVSSATCCFGISDRDVIEQRQLGRLDAFRFVLLL